MIKETSHNSEKVHMDTFVSGLQDWKRTVWTSTLGPHSKVTLTTGSWFPLITVTQQSLFGNGIHEKSLWA